ncbi:MAG TPA: methyltransferase domain-containing protein [Bacteroidota bacterium]|nr:methyltransferase domain-containing protein [Bacteroidota bacterium]
MTLQGKGVTTADSYAETRKAFDAAAPAYDAAYEHLPGIRRIRSITRRIYLENFTPGSRILELNCGTGNDAVFLAQQGMHVLATDISPGMMAQAEKKLPLAGATKGSVRLKVMPFEGIPDLSGEVFDGACSNFGGLNCTERLEEVSRDLAELIRPAGTFIATVMPPFCLWETAAFLARLRWKQAFRRMSRGGIVADLHGGHVRTYYFGPGAFRRAFSEHFDHVRTLGLAILMPPPNFTRLGGLTDFMGRVDDIVGRIPLVRAIGDHYTIVLRRKG